MEPPIPQSAAAAAVVVAVTAAVVVAAAAAESAAAAPQHDDNQKNNPDPAAAVGRAKHMLVPFPAPEISAPRLRGNRRTGVGGLTGVFPAAFGLYYVYDQENVTTDKKSSLSERFKALRDKVADVITAAEEEEASVAGAVSPKEPIQPSTIAEKEKENVIRRASNDEIASALMKFTWANDLPTAEEKPEEVKAFFEDFLPDIQTETEAVDADAEYGNEDEQSEQIDNTELPAEEETESESKRWDRIIAEAEALLEQGETVDPETDLETGDEPAHNTEKRNSTEDEVGFGSKDEPELEIASDFLQDSAANDQEDQPAESHGKNEFSWAELLNGIQNEDLAEQEESESALEDDIKVSPSEGESEPAGDEHDSVQPETGIAALLASLRKNTEKNRSSESAVEETPDISMFLTDADESMDGTGESVPEPDPADVARLWEPHAERRVPEVVSHDPSVDPIREETHVFTEEDLKNMPKEDSAENSADAGSSVEDYLETDNEEEGYTPRDFRPIRRRRYYRTGLVGGIMYFLFVICVSVALACFAWLAADDMLSLNKEYLEAEVYVGADMDVDQVATELQTKGLIRYRRLFALFGKFFHADEKIEPGTYTLSTKLDYRALIQNMHHYTGWTGEELATVKVTIPEGKTVMETFQILAEHGVCPYETLMECAATEKFDYSFLSDIPKGDATRLEGYLFPDTYEFYADSSPKAAICRFLDNFGDRIGDRVTEQAAAQGYTLREILTVASLIEKEAGSDLERARIASVIYNRLQSTSYPYLQIDATIQYAMGEHKEHLTNEDLQVDSPYNTYLYPGLPPGPIANPGLASIRAALSPESTGYYFYALNKNGKHEFFSSYSAFERFINSSNFGG